MSTETTPVPALVVAGVEKRFGATTALAGIDLEVGPAELVVLVGPSGCGKSTLLRVVAGLAAADAGRVCLAGEVVDDGPTHVPPERRGVGLVFQEHSLFPHLDVAGNVAFGLRRQPRAERATRVAEVLELVGLSSHGRRYPHELSGGERQRVALARALAPRPSLLLLDEPFASLDTNLRSRIRAEIVAILRRTATPALFVTHDQHEALTIADRLAVMDAGRLRQVGTPWEVFHRPADRFVAAFLGDADFVPVTVEGDCVVSSLGRRPHLGGAVGAGAAAMVRPDDVTFEVDPAGDGTIVAAEFHGAAWTYHLRLDSGDSVRSMQSHLVCVDPGTRVRASLVPGHDLVVVPEAAEEALRG